MFSCLTQVLLKAGKRQLPFSYLTYRHFALTCTPLMAVMMNAAVRLPVLKPSQAHFSSIKTSTVNQAHLAFEAEPATAFVEPQDPKLL